VLAQPAKCGKLDSTIRPWASANLVRVACALQVPVEVCKGPKCRATQASARLEVECEGGRGDKGSVTAVAGTTQVGEVALALEMTHAFKSKSHGPVSLSGSLSSTSMASYELRHSCSSIVTLLPQYLEYGWE
jgi:hypothetical protein